MALYINGKLIVSSQGDADIGGDLAVSGTLDVTGNTTLNGTTSFKNWMFIEDNDRFNFGTGVDTMLVYNTDQTPDALFLGLSGDSRSLVVAERADVVTDFAPGLQTNPTVFVHASDESDVTKRSALAYDTMTVSAGNGSAGGLKTLQELVTIPVGQGATGVVTSGNLAPVSSLIKAVGVRVVTAPGGGATTFDVGVTGSGNLDSLIDGLSTAASTTGTSPVNNDGTQLPLVNAADATLTVTTDVNVATSDMEVRIVVWYEQFTPPTS